MEHPASRPLRLQSIHCWLRDVPRLTVNVVARIALWKQLKCGRGGRRRRTVDFHFDSFCTLFVPVSSTAVVAANHNCTSDWRSSSAADLYHPYPYTTAINLSFSPPLLRPPFLTLSSIYTLLPRSLRNGLSDQCRAHGSLLVVICSRVLSGECFAT